MDSQREDEAEQIRLRGGTSSVSAESDNLVTATSNFPIAVDTACGEQSLEKEKNPLSDGLTPHGIRSKWRQEEQKSSAHTLEEPGVAAAQLLAVSRKRKRHIALLIAVSCVMAVFSAAAQYPAESMKVLGDASISLDFCQLARQFYTLAFKNNPNFVRVPVGWSEQMAAKGNYYQAAEFLTLAIDAMPDNSSFYVNRGIDNAYAPRLSEALADCEFVVKHNPKSGGAYNNRGCVHFRLNEFKSAVDDFSESIKLAPDEFEYLLNRGKCYVMLRRYDLAVSDFIKAVKIQERLNASEAERQHALFLINEYGWDAGAHTHEAASELIAQLDKDTFNSLLYARGYYWDQKEHFYPLFMRNLE